MRWLEFSAWTLGAALMVLYAAVRIGSEHARAAGIEEFYQANTTHSGSPEPPARQPGPEQRTIDQSLWSSQRVAAYMQEASHREAPLAVLRIPTLALDVPVYSGTSEVNLNRGAGHIEGTAPLAPHGNIGIAAHRDGFFRALERIAIDTDVYLEADGRVLRYRVVDIAIVAPTDVHVLESTSAPSVTLVTCYPFYFLGSAPERYIVRAELVAVLPAGARAQDSMSPTEVEPTGRSES